MGGTGQHFTGVLVALALLSASPAGAQLSDASSTGTQAGDSTPSTNASADGNGSTAGTGGENSSSAGAQTSGGTPADRQKIKDDLTQLQNDRKAERDQIATGIKAAQPQIEADRKQLQADQKTLVEDLLKNPSNVAADQQKIKDDQALLQQDQKSLKDQIAADKKAAQPPIEADKNSFRRTRRPQDRRGLQDMAESHSGGISCIASQSSRSGRISCVASLQTQASRSPCAGQWTCRRSRSQPSILPKFSINWSACRCLRYRAIRRSLRAHRTWLYRPIKQSC